MENGKREDPSLGLCWALAFFTGGKREKAASLFETRESEGDSLESYFEMGIVEKKDAHSRLDRLVQASAWVYKPIWVGECPLMWAHGGVGCCNGF